ncbi:MAG: hypothetical protein M3Y72_25095 [Acidobacteriota bacterium]|nr:hypothetical protein [Acidobacteriota bacterium]
MLPLTLAFISDPIVYGALNSVSLGRAKTRRLSANRRLLELIEDGIDAEKRKEREFFALAERFRNENDPEIAKRLGDQLGRMVFGG